MSGEAATQSHIRRKAQPKPLYARVALSARFKPTLRYTGTFSQAPIWPPNSAEQINRGHRKILLTPLVVPAEPNSLLASPGFQQVTMHGALQVARHESLNHVRRQLLPRIYKIDHRLELG